MEADVLEVGVEAKAGAQARVEWRRRQMEAGAGRGGGWVGDQAEAEAGWGGGRGGGWVGWGQRRRLGGGRQWLAAHWTSRMTSFLLLGSCEDGWKMDRCWASRATRLPICAGGV